MGGTRAPANASAAGTRLASIVAAVGSVPPRPAPPPHRAVVALGCLLEPRPPAQALEPGIGLGLGCGKRARGLRLPQHPLAHAAALGASVGATPAFNLAHCGSPGRGDGAMAAAPGAARSNVP